MESSAAASGARPHRPAGVLLGLAGVGLLALWLRSLGFEWIFVGHDEVVLRIGDGLYHARRALVTFLHFPSILVWDSYINYPRGAAIQLPPLYDLLTATVARCLGDDLRTFEWVLAWWGPLSGSIGVFPVYAAARRVCDAGGALIAALVFAMLPILVTSSSVGDADKTAFVGLLGACLLAVAMALVSPGVRGRRLVAAGAGLALIGIALPLCWSGSLLYTAIAYGLIVLTAALCGRSDTLAVVALALLSAGMVLLPVARALPEPIGGTYSALSFSRLHVHLTLAAGAAAAAAALFERLRPQRSVALRFAGVSVIAVLLAGAHWANDALREGLLLGFQFVGGVERGGTATMELLPLFPLPGRPALQSADLYFGLFAYLVPLAPLGPLLVAVRNRDVRAPALLLAGWSGVLAALTLWQVRYGADFAAPGAVTFSLLLAVPAREAARRLSLSRALVPCITAAVVLALFWKPIWLSYAPETRSSLAALAGRVGESDRALATPAGSLKRFMQEVRQLTPETSGYLGTGAVPEYGILANPNLGYALHYNARRASPANGFQHLLDPEIFGLAREFFQARSEKRGLEIAELLNARFVVTMHFPDLRRGSLGFLLQNGDGTAEASGARVKKIRLITEGPRGGRPMSDLLKLRSPSLVIPYKLFEIVAGAVIQVPARRGVEVLAEVTLRTPTNRKFTYRALGTAGPLGFARIRVPYATDPSYPVAATGAYRVRSGDRSWFVEIPELAVVEGRTVPVPVQSTSRQPASVGLSQGSH